MSGLARRVAHATSLADRRASVGAGGVVAPGGLPIIGKLVSGGVTGGHMPTETGKEHETRSPRRVGVLTIFCLAFSLDLFGQGAGNSTVTGTVVDNVGVVPDAAVTL